MVTHPAPRPKFLIAGRNGLLVIISRYKRDGKACCGIRVNNPESLAKRWHEDKTPAAVSSQEAPSALGYQDIAALQRVDDKQTGLDSLLAKIDQTRSIMIPRLALPLLETVQRPILHIGNDDHEQRDRYKRHLDRPPLLVQGCIRGLEELAADDAREIRTHDEDGHGDRALARRTGVQCHPRAVYAICVSDVSLRSGTGSRPWMAEYQGALTPGRLKHDCRHQDAESQVSICGKDDLRVCNLYVTSG